MNRSSFAILVLGSLGTACTTTVNTRNSPSEATESSLMQADRDFCRRHTCSRDRWLDVFLCARRDPHPLPRQHDQRLRRDPEIRSPEHLRHHEHSELGAYRCVRVQRWVDRLDHRQILGRKPARRGHGEGARKWPLCNNVASQIRTMAGHHGHRLSKSAGCSLTVHLGRKKPRTLSGTGLATGGPPVLQARPVAPILRWERQFRPVLLDSSSERNIPTYAS